MCTLGTTRARRHGYAGYHPRTPQGRELIDLDLAEAPELPLSVPEAPLSLKAPQRQTRVQTWAADPGRCGCEQCECVHDHDPRRDR